MSRKVTLTLPDPVARWFEENASLRHVHVSEYFRMLAIEWYTNADVDGSFMNAHVNARSAPFVATGKTAKTRSGYKGVYPYGKRWQAMITIDGVQTRIGTYDTPEQAADAYDRAAVARAGHPSAAFNAIAANAQEGFNADAPYLTKIQHGKPLSDVEMAAWKRDTANLAPAPSSALPVTLGAAAPDQGAPIVPPVRRQLRHSGPSIVRPAVIEDNGDEDGAEVET